ncbi:MAG: DUF211 domain-containing protein [Candidatus Aenigmatarchaeota archaeon]
MLKRLVLGVLKPYEPDIAVFSEKLSEIEGLEGINVSLLEIDREVENVKVTMQGNLDYDKIKSKMKDLGASIHSVDEASSGDIVVKEAETVHERRKRNGLKG